MTSGSGVTGWPGRTGCWPNEAQYHKESSASDLTSRSPQRGEVFGLYVVPEARAPASPGARRPAAALATQQAYLQLYYWVGTDNGRAIGFAKNFGFRTTDYRRPSRSSDLEPGEEIAMVLSLEPDQSAPNPTSEKPASSEGPLS